MYCAGQIRPTAEILSSERSNRDGAPRLRKVVALRRAAIAETLYVADTAGHLPGIRMSSTEAMSCVCAGATGAALAAGARLPSCCRSKASAAAASDTTACCRGETASGTSGCSAACGCDACCRCAAATTPPAGTAAAGSSSKSAQLDRTAAAACGKATALTSKTTWM